MIPAVIALVLLIPQIGIYGIELFKTDGDITSGGVASNIVFYGTTILELILGIFTIVFSVVGISEVQKFGIGNAILNLLLPAFLILIPLLLLILMIRAF